VRYLVGVVAAVGLLVFAGPALAAPSASVAALQVALRAGGHYAAPVDGLDGPLTQSALATLKQRRGISDESGVGPRTRSALGTLGRPLLGQRELGVSAIGWDVSSLEFQLRRFGLPARAVDGRFGPDTAAALRRFQKAMGLTVDGIAGPRTFKALAKGSGAKQTTSTALAQSRPKHTVRAGESFFSIAQLYRVSPLVLAGVNGLKLSSVIVPGKVLRLPVGASVARTPASPQVPAPASPAAPVVSAPTTGVVASADLVRASLDRWSAAYGVDPKLARAVAWMESGFRQDVVSSAGAVGVMQLLPATWAWVDTMIGRTTPRTYDGNVQAGVRLLRWLLDEFDGDVQLALAGYYQGAAAVRSRGLFEDTKRYVAVVRQLYGTV
jgi:soluble lytic murein transglycosylase-like protein